MRFTHSQVFEVFSFLLEVYKGVLFPVRRRPEWGLEYSPLLVEKNLFSLDIKYNTSHSMVTHCCSIMPLLKIDVNKQ